MKVSLRTTQQFLDAAREDLDRRHAHAAERVGFFSVRAAGIQDEIVLYTQHYYPLHDDDYLLDESVGAMMSQEAIRKALNIALLEPVGMIHVHLHSHRGHPDFSRTDLREQKKFVPDFFKVGPQMPHGAIVLSYDGIAGRIWLGADRIAQISEFVVVGHQLRIEREKTSKFSIVA